MRGPGAIQHLARRKGHSHLTALLACSLTHTYSFVCWSLLILSLEAWPKRAKDTDPYSYRCGCGCATGSRVHHGLSPRPYAPAPGLESAYNLVSWSLQYTAQHTHICCLDGFIARPVGTYSCQRYTALQSPGVGAFWSADARQADTSWPRGSRRVLTCPMWSRLRLRLANISLQCRLPRRRLLIVRREVANSGR